MAINFDNFFNSQSKKSKMGDFQDLEHLDGISVSTTSAKLYNNSRDDVVMFYFRKGANHASVYTQSKIVSENIKWNLLLKKKRISALIVNARNANAFTGDSGKKSVRDLASSTAQLVGCHPKQVFVAQTGVIGEEFLAKKVTEK